MYFEKRLLHLRSYKVRYTLYRFLHMKTAHAFT
nr:MAG TPA: hypothetical protein [Caudoviricetes sp.]